MGKNIVSGIFCIILGGVLFIASIGTLSQPNTVACGGQTMSQGDTCVEINNDSSSVSRDYDQQQQSNQGGAVFGIIGSLVFLALGIFMLRPHSEYPSVRSSSDPRPTSPDERVLPPGAAPPSTHLMPQSGTSSPSLPLRQPEGGMES